MKVIRPWTTLEERRAVELRRARHTLAAIAAALNRTRRSVSLKLSRLGATRSQGQRRRPGNFARAVARVWRPDRSDVEIARRLSVSFQAVWQARRKLALPPGRSPVRLRWLRCWCCDRHRPRHRAKGWVCRSVGHTAHGVSETYCRECFEQYGWPEYPRGRWGNRKRASA